MASVSYKLPNHCCSWVRYTSPRVVMSKSKLILLLSMALAGCASHPAVGIFQDYNEIFYGEAAPQLNMDASLFIAEGVFSMRGETSGIQCDGRTSLTSIGPPSSRCAGQKGNVRAECDDGRLLSAQWSSESCAVGFGHGQDNNGLAFAFTFGMPKNRAVQKIEQYLGISKHSANLLNTNQNR